MNKRERQVGTSLTHPQESELSQIYIQYRKISMKKKILRKPPMPHPEVLLHGPLRVAHRANVTAGGHGGHLNMLGAETAS